MQITFNLFSWFDWNYVRTCKCLKLNLNLIYYSEHEINHYLIDVIFIFQKMDFTNTTLNAFGRRICCGSNTESVYWIELKPLKMNLTHSMNLMLSRQKHTTAKLIDMIDLSNFSPIHRYTSISNISPSHMARIFKSTAVLYWHSWMYNVHCTRYIHIHCIDANVNVNGLNNHKFQNTSFSIA